MGNKAARLFFIDAMRAWAILMMLQGHFVDGLLDPVFRDPENGFFTTWKYFRGITAPVFFTVSGFIFTFLLIRTREVGFNNPRVMKGLRRGLQLLFIGYLLRLNFFGLFKGQIYDAFFLVDVLHIIGLSILGIVAIYLLTYKKHIFVFPAILLAATLLLFLFEPIYKQWTFAFIPEFLANYFTRANGSVFTIIPWFGYTAFGAFASILFTRYKEHRWVYPVSIGVSTILGFALIFFSSDLFLYMAGLTDLSVFTGLYSNNYLFIRLGDVFLVFAAFMLIRHLLTSKTILRIGQNTLSIYVIHFIILYGSFTGLGLYRFFHHSLTPQVVIPGALVFMVICAYTSLLYAQYEGHLKSTISGTFTRATAILQPYALFTIRQLKIALYRGLRQLLSLIRARRA